MDGFQERLRASLQLRLSIALALAIVVTAVAAGAFSFVASFNEAHELQDDLLRQVGHLVEQQGLPLTGPLNGPRRIDGDEESRVLVQPLGVSAADGRSVDDGGALALPITLRDGMQTLEVGGEAFRVLVGTRSDGQRFAVAQEVEFRTSLALDSALHAVLPFLVFIPVLLLVVATLIRRMFAPIHRLAEDVERRAVSDLRPLRLDGVPSEVRPFAASINGLLDRVSATLTAQRRFVADAAHELRSPLTALTLQAERLGNATMSEAARERLLALQGGIDRSRALIEQMLALARSQSTAGVIQQRTSARPVIAQVVVDLLPLADARRIDFGVSGEDEAWVSVSALDFATLIRNLADNALRYTPEGGRVDIALRRDEHALRIDICDDGPGIAPEERERVFDPFYRGTNTATTGSGLGLAIVRTIAERYAVTITLDWRDAQTRRGLCARLRVPLAADAQ